MKRHTVMELFHSTQKQAEDCDWIDIKTQLPKEDKCKIKVKLKDESEIFAYFYSDRANFSLQNRHKLS